MRLRTPRRKAGYTLTELMMVVAITGILFAAGPPMLVQLQNFWLMTSARYEIERDARVSLDSMNRFLRQGKISTMTIDSGGANSCAVTACSGSGGAYSRISFNTIDGRPVQYFQSGNYLCEKVSNNCRILSSDLIYIAFSFPESDSPTIVSVAITMGKNIQLGKKKVLELTIQKVRVMN